MSLYLRHFPGDPDRPALALHCMMGSGAMWGPIAKGLDGRVDLRALDMPGHGRSPDWPEDGDDLHGTVTRAAAALITRPVDLIGHSFGATVALRIAVGAPEAIRSLTLIEPVLFAATRKVLRDAEAARLAPFEATHDWAGMAQQFLSDWGVEGADALPPEGPQRDRLLRQIRMVSGSNRALMDDSGKILREGGLEAIDAPVMLISGENSPPIMAEIMAAIAARLPDVGRAVMPGAGHMLPATHPAQTAELIGLNLARA